MSKQDRQGVRKASDIEQKYNLALLKNMENGGSGYREELSKFEQEFSQYMVSTNGKIDQIEEQLEQGINQSADDVTYDNASSSLLATDVQGAIDELAGNKVDKTIEYYGDIDALVTSGFYRVGTNTNLPTGYEYGQIIVSRGSDTASQICMSYHTGRMITRSCNSPDSNPNWTTWHELATISDLENIETEGGFDLSYESENEALTLLSGSTEAVWNLLTEQTGTTGTIDLPTVYEELHILIGFTNYMYTFSILSHYLTDTAQLFRNGYAISTSVYGDVYVSLTKSQITAWTVRKENVVQTATVKVYYR